MMRPAATPLVGRRQELVLLDGALSELATGRWVAIELVGEPGIGKTRMLDELARRADGRGHLVLTGSAGELERDLPFWVFVSALDDYVRGLDPRPLDLGDGDLRADLGQVLPSFVGSARSARRTALHARYRTHQAVRELLERLTSARPMVLVLDDLHWADPASVELLAALLRRPPVAPVLVALALRPGQVDPRLAAELERALRTETLLRLPLDPLSHGESHELLGSSVDTATVSALYEESGGNPFYLEQLAWSARHHVDASGAALPHLTSTLDVPPAVAAALTEESTLLTDTARRVLRGAAVVGDPFEPEMAAAAAGVTEAVALAAFDELMAFEVIRQTDAPRRFRFRHPLVRRAVYESTPPGWRLTAHQRSASALATRGAPPSERAHHVARSARQGDGEAVATLRAAGEEAAHRAPESAARWFAQALRLLRKDAPAAHRVELLLARAGALASCGHFVEAHAALLESIDLVPTDATALRVRITTACAGTEHLLGRHRAAHRRLEDTLRELADAGSPEAVALMLELAVDGLYRLKFPQVDLWARRALDAARPLGSPALVAGATAALAWGAALGGLVPEAERHRAEAAGLVDGLPDQELAQRLDGVVHLAGAELYLDRFESAGAHAERAIAVARATGQPAFVPFAFMILAWVRMLRGEPTSGAEMLDAAIEEARLLGNTQTVAGLLLNRSLTALETGDLPLAVSTAREGVDLTDGLDAGLIPAATSLALAAVLLESGASDLGDAVDLMVRRCGGPGLPLMPGGSFRAKWLELLTRCSLALGRREDAERAAAGARAAAEAMGGLEMAAAMAERASAEVALDAGNPELAAQRALSSAAHGDDVGIPVEAALSRTVAGRALAMAGHPHRAVIELDRAAATLHACGALRYRDAAELELRRLGRHVYRRSRPGAPGDSGVETLTHREREVAELIVDRRTNAEIAAGLFLSPKTVETHVHNILRKLEVSSRVEVARAVEALGRES